MWHVISSRTLKILFMLLLLLPVTTYSNSPTRLPQSETQPTNYKSYHEWKKSKINEIELRLKVINQKISETEKEIQLRAINSKDPNLTIKKNSVEAGLKQDLQNQFEEESLKLSVSRDLTISDYFVGYLTKQNPVDAAIREVSGRLTAEEVAELMIAFADHFYQTSPAASKTSSRADSSQ